MEKNSLKFSGPADNSVRNYRVTISCAQDGNISLNMTQAEFNSFDFSFYIEYGCLIVIVKEL